MTIDPLAKAMSAVAAGRFSARKCRLCNRQSLFLGLADSDECWRCVLCGANRRYELVGMVLRPMLAALPPGARVVETDHRSPLRKLFGQFAGKVNYIRSAYVPGEAFGATLKHRRYRGARNEDLTALSFESESVDLMVACDVLEHVERLDQALGEIARVLKPGGAFIFSVPQVRVVHLRNGQMGTEPNHHASYRKAITRGGELVFMDGVPEFHIDPLVPSGIPVFWSFGPDAVTFIQARTSLWIEQVAGPEGPDRRVVFRGAKR